MILLLSDEEIRGKSSWNKLARRFFKEYNESIHAVCGYDTGIDGIGNIVVERDFSELFLYTVGGCMRTGILTDCSFDKMAEYIDLIFDTGYTKNTVLNKLKEQNPDYFWIEKLLIADKKRIILAKKKKNEP